MTMSSADSATSLASTYDPAISEPEIRRRWDEAHAFAATAPTNGTNTYSIVIPPPNVTAALHLGHALNNALQDVLVRYHRMRGDATLWMPGTDHAGIATQTVVEKRLLADGVKRLDMGREAFVEKTQEWKDEYEEVILDQMKEMGASCDWDRTRFTMDEMCATAVRHAFYTLFSDGLIYRGKRLVNWDPVTRTALADDEVESEEVDGHMWYLRYPLSDGSGHLTVATTRPETMLGDTAVAVNPNDPRAEGLRGKSVRLPIVDRVIPIVEDDYVVMTDPEGDTKAQYATGFLKVTPAHDPNDWEIGLRHDLDIINVMAPDGSISADHGFDEVSEQARIFVGLDRDEARTQIVSWFEDNDLLEEVRPYSHSVGHSYRSHVPIEPYLSDQWYVAVTDDRLRGSALRSQDPKQVPPMPKDVAPRSGIEGDGGLRLNPSRYARTFQSWHEGIRDWCISRQLWWGHQIPVWTRTLSSADADTHVADALVGIDGDNGLLVESEWTRCGAAHLARTIGDEISESVCVPPQATLNRIDGASDEIDLVARLETAGFTRDPDVLDTWFSSGLWPMSTMGWPFPEDFPETAGLLDSFNPTSVLLTAREIITLWVSRMVMFNRYFLDGRLPFDDTFIHAMIQDGHGQKMSKSLGNGVDPRDIIHSHGADAMRFALVSMTTDTQDVRMPVDVVCPHTGESFEPEFITTNSGHRVAAPIQTSPSDPSKKMVSAYGLAVGDAEPTAEIPLARNTSAKFDLGRNFANKVWNTVRFGLGRLGKAGDTAATTVDPADCRFIDRWILSRLAITVKELEDALDRYQFNTYMDTLYDFVWHDVSDRYLEAVKPTIDDDANQQVVLGVVLDATLRLIHPVCPFVTEALWPHLRATVYGQVRGIALEATDLAATSAWPCVEIGTGPDDVLDTFERADTLTGLVRSVRSERDVKPRQQVTLHVDEAVASLIESAQGFVETLAGIGEVVTGNSTAPAGASVLAFEGSQVLMSGLVDAADLDTERERLGKLISGLTGQVEGFNNKLSNRGYLDNAPPELVEETRGLLAAAEADLAAASAALDNL